MATTQPAHDDAPLNATHPTYWLLLLLAVVAFAWWYFANRSEPAPAASQGFGIIEGTAVDDSGSAASASAPPVARNNGRGAGTGTASTGSSTIREPQLLSTLKPQYPAAARRHGVEGDVVLRINIGADGVPTDVGYASRSGDPDLDRAAIKAAHKWRFQPATRNGDAIASVVQVPVAFRL